MILMSTIFNMEKMLGLKIPDINVYRIQHRENVRTQDPWNLDSHDLRLRRSL